MLPHYLRPSFSSRLYDCCCGSSIATCSGPRRPSFIRTLCEFRLCRGTLLCNSRRPSFIRRPCDIGILSRHCPSQTREAELHHHQQALRLVHRRRRHCTLHHHETLSQFAWRSTVALVHAGPASPPRLSPANVDLHHQGFPETPSTPFETTLVSSVSFSPSGSSIHTSSSKKRHSLAMRCTLALFLGWPQEHTGLQQSNSQRTCMAPSMQNW